MTIASPNFIIHAAGSLGNRPDMRKRAYRLHCRFQIEAYPAPGSLERARRATAEVFIEDMMKRGYDYVGESSRLPPSERGFRMEFKGSHIAVTNPQKPKRVLSAKEMLPQVMQGNKFRATDRPAVMDVPDIDATEYWDFDLSCIFMHDTILSEIPDRHEETRN